jgi:hypothetical protein
LAVAEPFVYEGQKQIRSFPAKAGPTGVAAGANDCTRCFLWDRLQPGSFCFLIVPTLRVVMPPQTLRVAPLFTSIIFLIFCIQSVLPRVVQEVAMAADLYI